MCIRDRKKAKEGEEIIRQIERDIALIFEEKDDKHLWMNYFTEYKDIKAVSYTHLIWTFRIINCLLLLF